MSAAAGAIRIVPAEGPARIADARRLIAAYADWLAQDHGISLAFQGIAAELATLPGRYAPPDGALLLATGPAGALGCVALRRHAPDTCEIKRLYVAPEARGACLGRSLARAILTEARRLGYARAILDTGPFMEAAQALYRDLGFREIAPYYDNPIPGCLYLARDLGTGG